MTQSGVNQDLTMDVYEPRGDAADNRPLVILAHGGSYFRGDKSQFSELGRFLAKSGYVVASISYRLIDVELDATSYPIGVVHGLGDMRAAVRFFRSDALTDNIYRIDPDNIFIGGFSAGAVTTLHYLYVNREEEIPALLQPAFDANGGIEGNSGSAGFSSLVKAGINIAGGILDVSVIEAGEGALISFHGTDDDTVSYEVGEADSSGFSLSGSGPVDRQAEALGVANELHSVSGGGHHAFFEEICVGCTDKLRSFLFGLL